MCIAFFLLALSLTAGSDRATADAPPADRGAATENAIEEGRLLYGIFCKSCHGPEGRGDGPMAGSLRPRPADLTRLSRENEGEFPLARVILSIDGRQPIPGHSTGRMPIWGLTLREPGSDRNQEDEVRVKIERVVDYLKSIQADPKR